MTEHPNEFDDHFGYTCQPWEGGFIAVIVYRGVGYGNIETIYTTPEEALGAASAEAYKILEQVDGDDVKYKEYTIYPEFPNISDDEIQEN